MYALAQGWRSKTPAKSGAHEIYQPKRLASPKTGSSQSTTDEYTMSSTTTSGFTAIQAYRSLYRALLHAVQFSKPARYVVRDQIRNAFRRGQPEDLNQLRIARTLEFLKGATQEAGLEHKILKGLIHTAWSKQQLLKMYVLSDCCAPCNTYSAIERC